MQNHSRSPVRPINNQRGNNNSNFAAANLFEFPNASTTTTNSGASITVNWIFLIIFLAKHFVRS